MVTGDETWLYQYDPEQKQRPSDWVFSDEDRPTKVKRYRSVGRKMVASFFGISGHVATVVLEDRRTVTSQWYATVCLPAVFTKIEERGPKTRLSGILLHYDNAPAHTAAATLAFLDETPIRLGTHHPYISDLAPCDLF